MFKFRTEGTVTPFHTNRFKSTVLLVLLGSIFFSLDTYASCLGKAAGAPFLDGPFTLPSVSGTNKRIQFEDYNCGGERYGFHEIIGNSGTLPGNTAGLPYRTPETFSPFLDWQGPGTAISVAWITGGEWLQYTINNSAVTPQIYNVQIKLSCTNADKRNFHFSLINAGIETNITPPNPNAANARVLQCSTGLTELTVSGLVIPAGNQLLRVVFDHSIDSASFDWMEWAPGASATLPPVQASQKAIDTANALGAGINFGNMFDSPLGNGDWADGIAGMMPGSNDANYLAFVDVAAAAGFKHIRLPVRWSNHATTDSAAILNTGFLSRMDAVIDKALARGLYVILDMHHYRQLDGDALDFGEVAVANDNVLIRSRFVNIWKQLATHYRDRYSSNANLNDHLLFELYNEPHGNLNADTWKELMDKALAAIRQAEGNGNQRIVVVSPANGSNANALGTLQLPRDENLIATFHNYNPDNFTLQGTADHPAIGVTCCSDVRNLPNNKSQRDLIIEPLEAAKQWSNGVYYPIYLGEFGAHLKYTGGNTATAVQQRVNYINVVREKTEELGIPWAYWELASTFGIYNPPTVTGGTGTWNLPELQALFPTPSAPQNLRATQTGDTSNLGVRLSWSRPSSDGGAAITGYSIAVASVPLTTSFVIPTSPTSVDSVSGLSGLYSGVPYQFSVRAVNARGSRGPAATVTFTPTTPPSPPVDVIVTNTGDGRVTLDWMLHVSGHAMGGYRVEYGPVSSGAFASIYNDDATPGATITGLNNGELYQFRVVALNTAGVASQPSAAVQAVPAAGGAQMGVWNLDGTGVDSSGFGHNGTVFGTPIWSAGKAGTALQMSGDDYAVLDNVGANTSFGARNTVSFWMKWDGTQNTMPFAWNDRFCLFFSDGPNHDNPSFGINTYQSNVMGISSAGLTGQWVHVAVVFTNNQTPTPSNSKIYINGVLQTLTDRFAAQGAPTTSARSASSKIILGAGGMVNNGVTAIYTSKFIGSVDAVRVFNGELSSSAIANLYQDLQIPTDIAAGYTHSCAVVGGGVQCWGTNDKLQLGITYDTKRLTPTKVPALAGGGVTAVATGYKHSCAIVEGVVKCWGNNSYAELGNGVLSSGPTGTPTPVAGLGSGVTAIASWWVHTCAIENGSAKCWGSNYYGQIGAGSGSGGYYKQATQVLGLDSGVTSITTGAYHSCAVKNGGVYCWGSNEFGQLGTITPTVYLGSKISYPVSVPGLGVGVVDVAAGAWHTCARLATGAVKCWGRNDFGQLGIGAATPAYIPTTVNPITQVVGVSSGATVIAAGTVSSCALVAGAAKCWGSANNGALGGKLASGGFGNSYVPLQVTNFLSGTQDISLGHGHTCAIKTGKAYCWGYGADFGRIGNGDQDNDATWVEYKEPVPVSAWGP